MAYIHCSFTYVYHNQQGDKDRPVALSPTAREMASKAVDELSTYWTDGGSGGGVVRGGSSGNIVREVTLVDMTGEMIREVLLVDMTGEVNETCL